MNNFLFSLNLSKMGRKFWRKIYREILHSSLGFVSFSSKKIIQEQAVEINSVHFFSKLSEKIFWNTVLLLRRGVFVRLKLVVMWRIDENKSGDKF